jgi:hypothetical protein
LPRSTFGNEQVGHDLNDHEDIDGGPGQTPDDGDSFVWSTSLGKWEFVPVAGGHSRGHSIHAPLDHTDFQGTPADGQVITWSQTAGKWEPQTPSVGHAQLHSIESAADHNVSGVPVEDQVLAYNDDTDVWEPVDAEGLVHDREHSIHGVSDHSDAPTVSPTDGQFLKWDETSGKYVAVDDESGASAAERPESTFLGSLLDYPAQGSFSGADEIQYTRIYLYKDSVISSMECFLEALPGVGSDIRMGIYNQVDPEDADSIPNVKVAETALYSLLVGDVGSFVNRPLVSSYLVPSTGYYWIAFTGDSGSTKYAASLTFRADFLPRYEESGTGTLPTTASALSNNQGAALYAAAKKQV